MITKFIYFALLKFIAKKNVTVIDVDLRIFPFHDLTFVQEKNSVKLKHVSVAFYIFIYKQIPAKNIFVYFIEILSLMKLNYTYL